MSHFRSPTFIGVCKREDELQEAVHNDTSPAWQKICTRILPPADSPVSFETWLWRRELVNARRLQERGDPYALTVANYLYDGAVRFLPNPGKPQ